MKPTQKDLIDTDGENRAVRAFLLGREVGCKDYEQMRRHMTNSGFDNCWPSEFASLGGHMSKAAQQMWLRHLFALERFGACGGEQVNQWRKVGTGQWWDGFPDHSDGGGPYETRTLYTSPSPTSGGSPTGYLVGHSGEYHYFRHKADAEREKTEQERCSGENCGDVEPVFRHPSPNDLRAAYLRGLEDAAKVADAKALTWRVKPVPLLGYSAELEECAEKIRALKGKQ